MRMDELFGDDLPQTGIVVGLSQPADSTVRLEIITVMSSCYPEPDSAVIDG